MPRLFHLQEACCTQLPAVPVATSFRKLPYTTSFAAHHHHGDASDERSFRDSAHPPEIMMKNKALEKQTAKVGELEKELVKIRQEKDAIMTKQLEELKAMNEEIHRIQQKGKKLDEALGLHLDERSELDAPRTPHARTEDEALDTEAQTKLRGLQERHEQELAEFESRTGEKRERLNSEKSGLAEQVSSAIEDLKAAEVERHTAAWRTIKQKIRNFEKNLNHQLEARLTRAPRAGTAPMLVEAPNAEPVWLTLSWTNPAAKQAQLDLRELAAREAAEDETVLGSVPAKKAASFISMYSQDSLLQFLQHQVHRRAAAAAFLCSS